MKLKISATVINITTISLIIGCFILTSQGSNKVPYRNIYAIELDFTNANFSAIIPRSRLSNIVDVMTLESSGLSAIYRIGLKHYCKGDNSLNGYSSEYCTSAKNNYFFNPKKLISDEITRANPSNNLRLLTSNDIKLPTSLPSFVMSTRNSNKSIPKIAFIVILVAVIAAGISTLLNISSVFFPNNEEIVFGSSFIASIVTTILLLVGAASLTSLYQRTVNAFKKEFQPYGISATLGNKTFYIMIWVIVALQLLFVGIVILYTTLIKFRKDSMPESKVTRISQTQQDLENGRGRRTFVSRFDYDSDDGDDAHYLNDLRDHRYQGQNELASSRLNNSASMGDGDVLPSYNESQNAALKTTLRS